MAELAAFRFLHNLHFYKRCGLFGYYRNCLTMTYLFCRRINVGTRFQAEIPSLQDRSLAAADEHKAELVWQPWGDLETNRVTQQNGKNVEGWYIGLSATAVVEVTTCLL